MRKCIMTFRKICKCTFHSHLIINLMVSDFMAKNQLRLIISKPMSKKGYKEKVLKEQISILKKIKKNRSVKTY